ncbi:MAG TPA: hypothetical protein DEP84_26000 [Chloroflexi bacterium]|nr:hypothetical protein [Chloroflexota bacterium]
MPVKLSREPLYEQAYEAILRMILDGTLVPGTRVTEATLARTLGVSPTPVREAMRKLEHDGLLESNGTGVQIIELRPDDIKQLYVCREALEVVAIERAVEKLGDEDLADLDELLTFAEEAAREGDFLKLVQINTAFHDRLIAAAANPWLMSTIGFVRRPLLLARIQITVDQREVRRILSDHRAILECLKQRDARSVVDAMRRHMRADCSYMCKELPPAARGNPN